VLVLNVLVLQDNTFNLWVSSVLNTVYNVHLFTQIWGVGGYENLSHEKLATTLKGHLSKASLTPDNIYQLVTTLLVLKVYDTIVCNICDET